jgi:hypothetical protein
MSKNIILATGIRYDNVIYGYCDVDGASLGKHPPPAVFLHAVPSRAEVSRSTLVAKEQ